MVLHNCGHAKNLPPLQCNGWGGSENENECVATSIRREVGISFGFTTTSWMDLVMENFFDFPLVTIIHSSRHNTIALMACLWMLIAFYRCTLFCPPTTLIYFGKKIGKNCFQVKSTSNCLSTNYIQIDNNSPLFFRIIRPSIHNFFCLFYNFGLN